MRVPGVHKTLVSAAAAHLFASVLWRVFTHAMAAPFVPRAITIACAGDGVGEKHPARGRGVQVACVCVCVFPSSRTQTR